MANCCMLVSFLFEYIALIESNVFFFCRRCTMTLWWLYNVCYNEKVMQLLCASFAKWINYLFLKSKFEIYQISKFSKKNQKLKKNKRLISVESNSFHLLIKLSQIYRGQQINSWRVPLINYGFSIVTFKRSNKAKNKKKTLYYRWHHRNYT